MIRDNKIEEKLNKLKKFDKSERSSFSYWYNHNRAFNLVAKKLGVWKFKYLFHDFEKPWLRLFLPYKKVQKIHRIHNNHHIEWIENQIKKKGGFFGINEILDKYDYQANIIDWECCRYTKNAKRYNAYNEYLSLVNREKFKEKYPEIYHYCYNEVSSRLFSTLEKLNLGE